MGLLGSLLTVGGAAAGFAVGGPAGAKLGAAIGGAAGGALSSSSGSSKAAKINAQAIKDAQGKLDTSYGDAKALQQPYVDFGNQNVNALTGRLGLSPSATATQTSANALTGGQLSQPSQQPATVLPGQQQVMQGSDQAVLNQGLPGAVPQSQVPLPTSGASPQAQPTGTALTAATGSPGAAAPGVDPGTYGGTENPTAPGAFSYTAEDYKESPGLQYALDRSKDVVQSSAAAGGFLNSGATLKELSDRAYQIALGDFNQERQFNYGLNRDARSDYQDNRNYLTSRFDTQTNNLFKGAGVGQNAANTASNAATNYGQQTAGLITQGGQAQANNALTQGQIGSDFASGLGGLISGFLPGTSSAAAPAANGGSNLGQVNYGNSLTSLYRY